MKSQAFVSSTTFANMLAFSISLAMHLGILAYLYVVINENEILMSKKDETNKALSINLNQISLTKNRQEQDEMKAAQIAQPQPKPLPQPKKPEPKKKVVKKDSKKQIKVEKQKEQEKPQPQPVMTPNIAKNEAINDGANQQISNSASNIQASAKNLLGEIYAAILKYKTYPKRAIDSKLEGKIVLEFKLKDRCEFDFLRLIKSSGSDYLDRHSIQIIKKSCVDFPDDAIGVYVKAPIVFNLKFANR